MPELPEVETTRRGITPHIVGKKVASVIVRNPHLRQPVPRRLLAELAGCMVRDVGRRGKYLLLTTDNGTVLLHLGMSGSLRIVRAESPPDKHDHVDIIFTHGVCLRLTDPRRFGLVLHTRRDPMQHALLKHLGPEPLEAAFDADYLYALSRGRRVAIKQFIMDARVVVGVGNIYASEALFLAGIHPQRAAGRISRQRYGTLVAAIKKVLRQAVKQGGTSLRDFVNSEGKPGYFRQSLKVYGHDGQPCVNCKKPVRQIRQGQRASYYCAHCQR